MMKMYFINEKHVESDEKYKKKSREIKIFNKNKNQIYIGDFYDFYMDKKCNIRLIRNYLNHKIDIEFKNPVYKNNIDTVEFKIDHNEIVENFIILDKIDENFINFNKNYISNNDEYHNLLLYFILNEKYYNNKNFLYYLKSKKDKIFKSVYDFIKDLYNKIYIIYFNIHNFNDNTYREILSLNILNISNDIEELKIKLFYTFWIRFIYLNGLSYEKFLNLFDILGVKFKSDLFELCIKYHDDNDIRFLYNKLNNVIKENANLIMTKSVCKQDKHDICEHLFKNGVVCISDTIDIRNIFN